MTQPNNEPSYPPDFDPTKFATPEMYLRKLAEPEVITIGSEMDADDSFESIAEEMDGLGFTTIGALVLAHADGEGHSKFPVYYTYVHSVVGRYEFDTPHPVTEEHVREAEVRVFNDERFADLDEEAKRRQVI